MENNGGKYSGYFSKKLRAGKRRTYFFDVRSTKQGDFFLTITESKKKFDGDGYESHKIFLYKEDFKKFVEALNETLDHVKTELMPDYDYDADRTVRTDDEDHGGSREGQAPRVSNDNHTRRRNIDDYPEPKEGEEDTTLRPDPASGEQNIDHKSSSGIGDDEEIAW